MPQNNEGRDPSGGIKFNQVGRDEPAPEILAPRIDPSMRRRTLVIACLAVVAILLLVLVIANPFGVQRSGEASGGNRRFERPSPPEAGL